MRALATDLPALRCPTLTETAVGGVHPAEGARTSSHSLTLCPGDITSDKGSLDTALCCLSKERLGEEKLFLLTLFWAPNLGF